MNYPIKTSGRAIVFLGVVLALYTVLFWPTLREIERVWRGSDTYSHSYIVPFIAYWLYLQRRKPNVLQLSNSWLPLMVLPLMVFGWMLGYASETGAIAHFSAILTLQIILVAWLGPELAKHYKFAIFYLIFLVPFGDFLNLPLQNITANLTVFILHALNIPVFREGLFLTTPVGHFEVAVACSGLRFLIASIAIGTLFTHLTYRSFWRQTTFVITLIVFSILANGLRAALLIFVAEESNMAYGFGADHYVYGWVVFGLVMLTMFWLGGKFSDLPRVKNSSTTSLDATSTLHIVGFTKVQTGLVIILLSLSVLWRMQLTIVPIVEKAPASLMLPGASTEDRLNWGIQFVHPQRVSLLSEGNNLSFYQAEFAHRQQQGKLISWNNKLFNEKIWTVSRSSDWQDHELSARHLVLSSLHGETLEIVYWYQIGSTSTTKAWHVKLAQMVALFSGDAKFGQINAVAVLATQDHNNSRLEAAVHRLKTMAAP